MFGMKTKIHNVADHIKEKEFTVYYKVYIVRQIKLSVHDKIHEIKLHSKNNDSYI